MRQGLMVMVWGLSWALSTSHAQKSVVLFDGGDASGWDTRRDPARLAREFASSSVSVTTGERPALLWSFAPRAAAYNDLWCARAIEDRFARVKIILENRGAALDFAVKMVDADNAEWTVKPIALPCGRESRELVIPLSDFRVASWSKDANGTLDFPVSQFVLIAFGIQPKKAYSLAVRSISLECDPPPQVAAASIAIPSTVPAGSPFDASFSATLLRGEFRGNDAAIELRKPGAKSTRIPLVTDAPLASWRIGERRSFSTGGTKIGLFARGGDFGAVLRLDGMDAELVARGTPVAPRVTIQERRRGTVVAEVRPRLGVPTLFIDGKPRPWLSYSAYGPSTGVFTDFEKAGVSLFCVMATPTDHGYSLARTAWISENEFDFSQLDERMEMVLAGDPDAHVIPRIYLAAPKWWCAKHPDEVVTHDPGEGRPAAFIQGGKPVPSWASEIWRSDTAAALRKLIAHVESSPYADRIIGYHVASGTTEEWMQWGSNDRLWVDYSPANLKRFRAWLAARYRSDAALQKAWGNGAATLATAAIPSKKERLSCRLGTLRDPVAERPSVDYALYTSDLVAETIAFFCATVKEATARTKLAGVFYGYVLQLAGEPRQQNAGHLALRAVWDCPDVDFISCPTSYAFRAIGTGTTHMMSLLDGALRAGKIWIDENDVRTSLSPGKPGEWGRAADVRGDILQQERELALVLSRGLGMWWFDVGRNRYDDPALMGSIARLARCGANLMDADRSPIDEIAFVVDSRGLSMMEVGNALSRHLIMAQMPEAHRIGAPVGWYDISDLDTLPPRKMYVFLNLFDPTPKDLANIARLKSEGRVLVYLYGAGVYENGSFSPRSSERLIGFPLEHRTSEGPLAVKMSAGAMPGVGGLEYAAGVKARGYFVPKGASGKILGTLPGGEPGLVMAERDGHTVFWSAGPALPAKLLRAAAARAGVHRYIETEDVVWAAKETLAVNVDREGKRTIRLRRPAKVTDVYSGATIADHAESFDAEFGAGGTRLFRLIDR